MSATKNIDLKSILNIVDDELNELESRLLTQISPNSRSLCSILQEIFKAGGKRLRPALSFMFAGLVNPSQIQPSEEIFLAAEIGELIHTASLVHDDIIDNSLLRRGKPTTNSKWSNTITVISGDFMFARAAVNLGRIGNNRVTSIFAQVLEDLCDGEIWQAEKKFITELDYEFYFQKTFKKTASLFTAACESALIISKSSSEMIQAAYDYGNNLGIAFQIVDDILDFTSSSDELGKPALSDLKEGHLTLPVLITLEKLEQTNKAEAAEFTKLISELRDETKQEDNLSKIKNIIEDEQGIALAIAKAKNYIDQATQALEVFPDNEYKNSLTELGKFILERTF